MGAKESAAQYTSVSIVLNEQDNDPSHSLVQDYDEALNELVAEQLQKVIIATYQHVTVLRSVVSVVSVGFEESRVMR